MQIGYTHWQWVSTDSAGVPHGGPFGDVQRFEAEAGKYGLIIGWSRIHERFGVCTRLGPAKWVCQWLLRKERTGVPIPFTDELLWLLLHQWNKFASTGATTIIESINQAAKDHKYAVAKAMYADNSVRIRDAIRESHIQRGEKDRKLFVEPRLPRFRRVGRG